MTDGDSSGYQWSNDPFWTNALERFMRARQEGAEAITLDLNAVDETIYRDPSIAVQLMNAMVSVKENEDWDGYRGSVRILYALLQNLKDLTSR